MVTHLASFDACVEAADALAVQAPIPNQERSVLSRKHGPSGLPDPSVLVSVDGNLLLIPPGQVFPAVKGAKEESATKDDSFEAEEAPIFAELMAHGKDDYESAVFLGNDIEGDRKLNGFSAMGWSLPATSHALGQCEASLQHLLAFTETVLLQKKEAAARTSQACDVLREWMPSHGGRPPVPAARTGKVSSAGISRSRSVSSVDEWEIVDPRANEFIPNTANRTGPLVAPDSNLNRALVVLEEFYAQTAEGESVFWRDASVRKDAMLPKLQEARHRVSRRVQQRDNALEEASSRARLLEERLQGLRKEAEDKWEKVYKSEQKVQVRLESLWQERSRQREKVRLDHLHKETERAGSERQHKSSTEDILNLVAQISDDGGSFEPMDLSSRSGHSHTSKGKKMDEEPPSLPFSINAPGGVSISRDAVEAELGLQELRAAAMAADEGVEDGSQDLLQALSNLDTIRRAARVVAETSMVNAANAQVECVRELVALERQALEQRLQQLQKLEESIPEVNVREDLDTYITQDKRERGGTSHLGDDDDGGIASALAVLSSHVDAHSNEGEMRSGEEAGENEDVSMSREEVLGALERFFSTDENESVKEAVGLLRKVAESLNSRSRRSTICYALNSKRSASAEIPTKEQFEGLCEVFSAVLTAYAEDETGNSMAKMLMMLAQTFYFLDVGTDPHAETPEASPSRPKREKRIYVRNRLTGHSIWSQDAFWDEAFRTAMKESLTVSGVMSNFERRNQMVHTNNDYRQNRRMMKWYDLSYEERIGAASQVHAVIFAQLGALAHSMMEFGCSLERSCAFVRRAAIRNQLPTSQRTMLLQHLMSRSDTHDVEPPTLS
jgi:hypothetical protein